MFVEELDLFAFAFEVFNATVCTESNSLALCVAFITILAHCKVVQYFSSAIPQLTEYIQTLIILGQRLLKYFDFSLSL